MSEPDGSETCRQPLLRSVVVSLPSGLIDRLQLGVLALVVLPYVRMGPVEEFATRWHRSGGGDSHPTHEVHVIGNDRRQRIRWCWCG